jgi:hypothetical protein
MRREEGFMKSDDVALRDAMLRLNGRAWGIAVGLMFGLTLFVATNVLILKGGEQIGPHLNLLSNYLPGYSVSFVGSVIGFIYLFVIGYAVGRLIGTVYNRMIGPAA